MNFIVAPCFTTVTCPQRGKKVIVSNSLIQNWADSLEKNGLRGIVVYDELPETIIYHFAPTVSFIRVEPPENGISCNDWRFYAYRQLVNFADLDLNAAFFTDLFDMVVQHDPFPWLEGIGGGLAFGREDRMDQGPWMSDKLTAAFGEQWRDCIPGSAARVTAGLFGGTREHLKSFFDCVCGIMSAIHIEKPGENCNMPAVQMAVHCGMAGRKVHFGQPLHAERWRWGEKNDDALFHHEWSTKPEVFG